MDGQGYNHEVILNFEIKKGIWKIIEYNDDEKLKYEKEYLNGEITGKGKDYDREGKLLFEGEYLNGKRNGKGKQFNMDGKLLFEGEYLKGKINGKGK